VQAPQTADLVPIFRQALASFRFAYVLYFQPRGVDLNGSHTVDIRVKRPGATVEARRGYWY
jgi:hypothetical protein